MCDSLKDPFNSFFKNSRTVIDHINIFMYDIHSGLTTLGRVVTWCKIFFFLPKLSEGEVLDRLDSQWDLPKHHFKIRIWVMRLQLQASHIPMSIFTSGRCIPDPNDPL